MYIVRWARAQSGLKKPSLFDLYFKQRQTFLLFLLYLLELFHAFGKFGLGLSL